MAAILEISNCDISVMGNPINVVFGSRVGFLGTADWTALFLVRSNPRWRLAAILKMSNGHISATGHPIHFSAVSADSWLASNLQHLQMSCSVWCILITRPRQSKLLLVTEQCITINVLLFIYFTVCCTFSKSCDTAHFGMTLMTAYKASLEADHLRASNWTVQVYKYMYI